MEGKHKPEFISISNSVEGAYKIAQTQGFALLDNTIDDAKMKQALFNSEHAKECGAFVSFEGWVRNHNNARSVNGLTYYGYEQLAINQGKQIIEQAKQKFAIADATAIHRVGELSIGDMAVWIGVVSAHRYPAFEACQWILDTIKDEIPVWKREFYDGGNESLWLSNNC